MGHAVHRVTIRQEGFEDHFEFLLRIDALQSGGARAVLTIPDREPLSVQLARCRLNAPAISLPEALSRVRLRKVALPDTVAKRLLQRLLATTIPARPQTGIFLHRPMFEVTILAWSELRVIVTARVEPRRLRRVAGRAFDRCFWRSAAHLARLS